jgi:SAM-dependent MidA family methyltransferase
LLGEESFMDGFINMLARNRIGQRLAEYYAQPSSAVVGSNVSKALNLSSLWGESHWKRLIKRLYEENEGQWLTPVELFKPFYSNILANFIANNTLDEGAVEIVELGGGRGTNALLILDYLQRTHPQIYDRMRYTIIDSSPTLLELQREKILVQGNHEHKVHLEQKDLTDVAEKRVPLLSSRASQVNTTIAIALELFDNLPHDKIRVRGGGYLVEQAELHPASTGVVHPTFDVEEIFAPLSDPLLQSVLQSAPTYMKGGSVLWIPSVACGVLQQLVQERPRAQLVVADFDWLPPPDFSAGNAEPIRQHRASTWAKGEPLITSMDDLDYACYLHAPGHCDILFPTDFGKLLSFVQKVWTPVKGRTPHFSLMKQADFLLENGLAEVESTKSWLTGYSPLIHDFSNCSVLTVRHGKLDSCQ